jgi:DNA-binding NarL/FixJ family response regulator
MTANAQELIRVLVVDDHAVVRHGLDAFLGSEEDIDVLAGAGGGEEALEVLAQLDTEGRRPHVVVMDLQMEPVDGLEATRQIRAKYGDEIAIVVLTSFGETERVRAAIEAGASGFILKDADADEVAVAIRSAHRGELQLDPGVTRSLTMSLGLQTAQPELTERELQVLQLLVGGDSNKRIAAALGISERTARTHVSNILAKLGVSSRTQAALWAAREGIVERAI